MRKELFFVALFVLLISLNFAQAADYSYKVDTEADIKIPCFNDDNYCSDTAECYLTINYPNGVNMINNQTMTNNGAYHNYTLSTTYTSVIGTYFASVVCLDDTTYGSSTFTYEITSTGASDELMNNIMFFVFLAFAIGLLILGLLREDVVFVFFAGMLFIVSGVFLFVNNILYLPTLLNNVFCYVLWGLGAYLIIMAAFKALNVEVD